MGKLVQTTLDKFIRTPKKNLFSYEEPVTPMAKLSLNKRPCEEIPRETKRPPRPLTPITSPEKNQIPEWLIDIRDKEGRRPNDVDYDPTSLYIPESAIAKFTDFEKQYWGIKSQYFDAVVFFKKGKFYELYERDADLSQREFDLKVSYGTRVMRMTGVPEARFEDWAERFVAKGFKVAKVDQAESMAAKSYREKNQNTKEKIIKRQLTAVLTSATLMNPKQADTSYAMAIFTQQKTAAAVFVDTQTARVNVCVFDNENHQFETLLLRINPKEIIIDKKTFLQKKLLKSLCPDAQIQSLTFSTTKLSLEANLKEYWKEYPNIVRNDTLTVCLVGMLNYLQRIRMDNVFYGEVLEYSLEESKFMNLDGATLMNLHVLGKLSLFSILDFCKTAMGKRLLRKYVLYPLTSIKEIEYRQEAIMEFKQNYPEELINELKQLPDIERLIGQIQMKQGKKENLILIFKGLESIKQVIENQEFNSKLLLNLKIPDLNIIQEFRNTFDFETFALKSNFEYEQIMEKIEKLDFEIFSHEAKAKKIHFEAKLVNVGKDLNLIQLPGNVEVPKSWKKVSGTKQSSRYFCPEIISLNAKRSDAVECQQCILKHFFEQQMQKFSSNRQLWMQCCNIISQLDVLVSLSVASKKNSFDCLPKFKKSEFSFLSAMDVRHPCFDPSDFITNNIQLKEQRTIMLTGPNMGGKSTLLRQIGLCVILAQIGSLVPCSSLIMSPFDAVFTRIGARDNIMQSQSTFLVELSETASILAKATQKSLCLFDELGRGTSTRDGQSLALSVLYHLCFSIRPCVLFATHYANMSQETKTWNINHSHMACIESDTVVFLYKLVPGVCSRSHGLNVAKMAKISPEILTLAEKVAKDFEQVDLGMVSKFCFFNSIRNCNSLEELKQIQQLY